MRVAQAMGKLLRVNMELGKCRDFVSPRGSERSGSPVLSPSRMTDADLATQEQAMKGAGGGTPRLPPEVPCTRSSAASGSEKSCHPAAPRGRSEAFRDALARVSPWKEEIPCT